ncbi:MAG: aminotransferase class I/II-fold pyridoxal phosphate-dependent enzyme, partial [Verrucomicrobiae bacterium]|nr:aminotransferase class I/II-fold pyridoxal phosphate-dependent enzyme [Verrucomicrobiae bacterium]
STIKGYYDYGLFQPVQIAAIVAMRHCEAAVDSIAAEYQMRRDVFCDGLERLGWEIDRPKAGMFVWAKIPEQYANGYELSDEVLYSSNVFLTPGGIFGSQGERFIRISLCSDGALYEEAIRRIEAAKPQNHKTIKPQNQK